MGINIFWDHSAPQGLQLPVARTIAMILNAPIGVEENPVLINGYYEGRKQYDARLILNRIELFKRRRGIDGPVLVILQYDLFSPGSDFVFGLARIATGSAVLSVTRLDNRYYSRLPDDGELVDRIAKEGAHEIGHLHGLQHCPDPECVMFAPQTLDELDRKKKTLCPSCTALLERLTRGDSSDPDETALL